MSLDEVKQVVDFWAANRIQNVRLSGGEPTVHPDLVQIVKYIKSTCGEIKHIAISTNGYADLSLYEELVACGVNDYSISLDACCSSVGDMMSGGVRGAWVKVVENIRALSKLTYVTVGMVFSQENVEDMRESILFAHDLGVSDIRIISAAQWNDFSIFESLELPKQVLDAHPILAYRIGNFAKGRNVRGISSTDSRRCGLLLDDMIVKGEFHYPCVIKMREGCAPIGKITDADVRGDRKRYFEKCDCFKDEVCQKNCLDVCVDYNNKHERFAIDRQQAIAQMPFDSFTQERWASGSVHDLGIEHFRYENAETYADAIRQYAIGYCFAESLRFKPKQNEVAIMCLKNGEYFWFHIRNNEFAKFL
jgi:MoaA/NifB/PqqE/SkfB family radical SAM enzyme